MWVSKCRSGQAHAGHCTAQQIPPPRGRGALQQRCQDPPLEAGTLEHATPRCHCMKAEHGGTPSSCLNSHRADRPGQEAKPCGHGRSRALRLAVSGKHHSRSAQRLADVQCHGPFCSASSSTITRHAPRQAGSKAGACGPLQKLPLEQAAPAGPAAPPAPAPPPGQLLPTRGPNSRPAPPTALPSSSLAGDGVTWNTWALPRFSFLSLERPMLLLKLPPLSGWAAAMSAWPVPHTVRHPRSEGALSSVTSSGTQATAP